MSAKHTPGWWEVRPIAADRVGIMAADDVIVASVYCPHDGHIGEADAALIAAAPELLQALQNVAAHWPHWATQLDVKQIDRDAIAIVREAIAKATGGAA